MADLAPDLLRARWYDGRSSQPQPVLVGLEPGPRGPSLRLHALAPGVAVPPAPFAHDAVDWPEAWRPSRAQATVVVDLRQAGSLEIDDGARWHAALEAAGARPGLAQRMQTRWPVFVAVLLAAVLGLALFYRYGTPWAATQLTRFVPRGWEETISREAMEQLDDGWLKPSRLPAERQAALQARFDALAATLGAGAPELHRYRGYAPRLQLAFRSGMPPNAFALPGGQVVMTDALVRAAEKAGLPDDALVGVLAHEIGHVMHRHGTRLVVEQGVLNIGLGLALGDVSSMVSTASTVLTGLAYRRNHEREADCFAVAMMARAALPVAPMADLLMYIDGPPTPPGRQAGDADAGDAPGQAEPPPQPRGPAAADWLSSHPDTAARAEALRAGRGCLPPAR